MIDIHQRTAARAKALLASGIEFTEKQARVLDAVVLYGGNVTKAATQLGMDVKNTQTSLNTMIVKGLDRGYSPDLGFTGVLPSGQKIDRMTAQFTRNKETGEMTLIQYWAKSKTDSEAFNAVMDAIKEEIPRHKDAALVTATTSDVITEYVVTDYHLGMLASKNETGREDWTLEIAENLLVDWFQHAINKAPPSDEAILVNLGDFMHYDGMIAVTNGHGHVLDASARHYDIKRAAVRALRKIIAMMLEKHQKVTVLMAEGNHDENSSDWLRLLLGVMFEESKRVEIIQSGTPYYAKQFGKVGLFCHHGHKKHLPEIDRILAATFPVIFGDTIYRYAKVGHYHHVKVNESALMITEMLQTLAPADAYAARGGYISGRSSKMTVYHKFYGKQTEFTITPEMVGK